MKSTKPPKANPSFFKLLPADLFRKLSKDFLAPDLFILWRQLWPEAMQKERIAHLDIKLKAGRNALGYCFLHGYFEILKSLMRNKLCKVEDLGVGMFANAVRGGHRQILEWAYANKCPMDEWACAYAAEGGHFEVLKWLRTHGCHWDEYTCALAAGGNQLEILKWARGAGCPWDAKTCSYAAKKGNLEVLKWAREEHCHWDEYTFAYAAEGGHFHILRWLIMLSNPIVTSSACAYAAYAGRLDILKWLRHHNCPWDYETISKALSKGHIKVVEWATANDCPSAPGPPTPNLFYSSRRTAYHSKTLIGAISHTCRTYIQ